jgi:pimeloyl-ACP methyl ester carboxylesterase
VIAEAVVVAAGGAVAGAASVAVGVRAVKAWSLGRWRAYHRRRGWPPPDPAVIDAVMSLEVRDTGRALSYFLQSVVGREPQPPAVTVGPPVLCVHGFAMHGSNFHGLRRALHAAGRPTHALHLGLPGRPVEVHARTVRRRLEALAATQERIDLVAHSMGGIVLRVVLRDAPALRPHIGTVVTLGTPHQGTAAARGWLSRIPEPADLHRRSALLATLPPLPDLLPHARIVTVGSPWDMVVYPPSSTMQEGAAHRELPVGHMGLVTGDQAIATVVEALMGIAGSAHPAPGQGTHPDNARR